MKYVFNPRNKQLNPVTDQTHVDASLRDKVVSPELYSLVCAGKVSVDDIAAMFAVNKSPEILLKNHKAVKESPVGNAPDNTEKLEAKVEEAPKEEGAGLSVEKAAVDANGAFDGRSMNSKTADELLIIATNINCPELKDPEFAPTRPNLMKAIKAKALAAEAGAE